MKKLLSFALMFVACFTLANQAIASSKHFFKHLQVTNNWTRAVKVEEGFIYKRNKIVEPGSTVSMHLMTGCVHKLTVSYLKDGVWQPIPDCAKGNYSSGLTVTIAGVAGNQNVPMCKTLVS